MAVCSLLDNDTAGLFMFSTDQFTIIFFLKPSDSLPGNLSLFFNKMEKHNGVNSRTRTKRGGIFITAAFTLI